MSLTYLDLTKIDLFRVDTNNCQITFTVDGGTTIATKIKYGLYDMDRLCSEVRATCESALLWNNVKQASQLIKLYTIKGEKWKSKLETSPRITSIEGSFIESINLDGPLSTERPIYNFKSESHYRHKPRKLEFDGLPIILSNSVSKYKYTYSNCQPLAKFNDIDVEIDGNTLTVDISKLRNENNDDIIVRIIHWAPICYYKFGSDVDVATFNILGTEFVPLHEKNNSLIELILVMLIIVIVVILGTGFLLESGIII